MLSEEQRRRTRAALYGPAAAADASLPVAPLSIAERVVDELLARNGRACGSSCSAAITRSRGRSSRRWRATWPSRGRSFTSTRTRTCCPSGWACGSASPPGRTTPTSCSGGAGGWCRSACARRRDRSSTGSRRWACASSGRTRCARAATAVIDDVIAHLRAWASRASTVRTTSTRPTARRRRRRARRRRTGFRRAFVGALIARVAEAFPLLGGDVVEVAPSIGSAEDARRTTDVAAGYMLGHAGGDDGRARTFADARAVNGDTGRKDDDDAEATRGRDHAAGGRLARSARPGTRSTRASWTRRGGAPSGWARSRPKGCSCGRRAAARRTTSPARVALLEAGDRRGSRSGRRPSWRSRSCWPRRPRRWPRRASTRSARSTWRRKRTSICRRWR